MSRDQKSRRLRQQVFITQLIVRGLLTAGTSALATARLRKLLIFWCGHDYRLALAACLVAFKTGARPSLGPVERQALFQPSDRRVALAARIAHRVLASTAGVKDEAATMNPGLHVDVVDWAVAAALGGAVAPAPRSLDSNNVHAVVEHAARMLALFDQAPLGERLAAAWAAIEQIERDRESTMVLAPLYRENIGHQAIVVALVQACRDGIFAQEAVHLLPGRPHNRYLVSLVEAILAAAPAKPAFVDPISGGKVYRTRSGEVVSVTELMSRAVDRWREEGPPLALDPETRRRGDDALAAIGIPPESPIVSLHVREPGWYAHTNAPNVRDADIVTYAPATAYLAGRGYRVIRLGDPSMTRTPDAMPVFDYAHSALKSDWMDVYIAARCRFHIGTASGMSFVPLLFGRPVLFTNYAPLDHLLDPRSTVTLFKVHRDLQGAVVPPEALAARHRHAASTTDLELLGAWLEDNDEDDILDAVRFVDAHIDGQTGELRFPKATFAVSDQTFERLGFPKRPQVPPRFWDRYYGGGDPA